jgi:hypothetical protein
MFYWNNIFRFPGSRNVVAIEGLYFVQTFDRTSNLYRKPLVCDLEKTLLKT